MKKLLSALLVLLMALLPMATVAMAAEDGAAPAGFSDVPADAWYAEASDYVTARGMMDGLDGGRFAPDAAAGLGTVVTALWRMAGEPGANGDEDTETTAYSWATAEGIIDASDTDRNAPVTREKLCATVYRFAKQSGEGFEGLWAFSPDFPDAAEVSDWACEGVCWLVMNGVVNGMDGTLNPRGIATRAQTATVMMRYQRILPMTYAAFKRLLPERQKQVFAALSGQEIYDLVAGSDESWPVTSYDLISPNNAKETVLLFDNNGDLHFNLAWPCYGGFVPESIASMGELSGTLDVSRDGGDGGHSLSYGRNADGSYPNDSQRSVPKSSATVRTGTLDVDRYHRVLDIVANGESEEARIEALAALGYDAGIAARFLSDQARFPSRDEVSGPNNISDGAMSVGHSVESKYGYYGITAPWVAGDLNLIGGGGQLCTVFSWGTLCASGLIYDTGTAEIH